MRKSGLFTIILPLLIFIGCQNAKKERLRLDNELRKRILSTYPQLNNSNLTIYYFNGDCSFCIADALEVEKTVGAEKNMKVIFIAKTHNPSVLLYNFRQNNIQSPILIDKTGFYGHYLKENSKIKIDADGNFL